MAGLRVSKNGSDPNYLFGMAGGFEFAKLVRIRAIFSGWQGAPSSQKWFGSELFFGMQGPSSSQKWFGSELFFRNGSGIRVRKNGSDPNYFFGMQGPSSSQKWFGSELFFRNGSGIRDRKIGS